MKLWFVQKSICSSALLTQYLAHLNAAGSPSLKAPNSRYGGSWKIRGLWTSFFIWNFHPSWSSKYCPVPRSHTGSNLNSANLRFSPIWSWVSSSLAYSTSDNPPSLRQRGPSSQAWVVVSFLLYFLIRFPSPLQWRPSYPALRWWSSEIRSLKSCCSTKERWTQLTWAGRLCSYAIEYCQVSPNFHGLALTTHLSIFLLLIWVGEHHE